MMELRKHRALPVDELELLRVTRSREIDALHHDGIFERKSRARYGDPPRSRAELLLEAEAFLQQERATARRARRAFPWLATARADGELHSGRR